MARVLPAFLALALALWVAPCAAQTTANSAKEARDYLEGIWLVGEKPERGACLSNWYRSNQVEFEFRKSGGRLLMFEPFDLYTAVAVPGVEVKDGVIALTARSREGKATPLSKLRPLDADRFQWVPHDGGEGKESDIAYRCGPPDRSVTGAVPLAALERLTPVLSGAQTFPEIRPGEDDRQVCRGDEPDPQGRRALQFELLGPDHYWVFGEGHGKREFIEFDRVRAVRQTGEHTLTLDMEAHPKGAKGWDASGGPSQRYSLTVIDKGDHIEVPELAATYVRCRADEEASYGMHRMN